MSERDYAPLSVACVRGLCDKIYEKRKFAGAEIEKMVKDFSEAKNTSQIRRLIKVLGQELMSSTNPNVKNGALMGLSSVAVGLGERGCVEYLSELVQPMMACVSESESRVRYQAVEALYNCVKMARGAALAHFPLLLDALARLAGDPEPQVRQAAELLDRLVKDVVTESPALEVGAVVRLLRERLYSRAPPQRQLMAGWVCVLDAVPALDLLPHLPDLLDPLFKMLDDPNPEIRRMVDVQLNEFLRSIKKEPARVDFQAMINVLITHAQSSEDLLQLTAITWIKEFVELSGGAMLPYASGILAAVLPCLAYADEPRKSIRETAATVNFQLTKLVTMPEGEGEGEGALDLDAVVGVLTAMLVRPAVPTKVAALDWILHLYNRMPREMYVETDSVFVCVVGVLTDAADDVVRRALAVLAEICECAPATAATAAAQDATQPPDKTQNAAQRSQPEENFTATIYLDSTNWPLGSVAEYREWRTDGAVNNSNIENAAQRSQPEENFTATIYLGDLESSPYYYKFLKALLRLLAADESLLEDRGAFIIRQLCVLLNAEDIYLALSKILAVERNLRFASTMVDVLSTILLTAPELYHLRLQLRNFDTPATVSVFQWLYRCWCHSPVSLLALCLLTHNYDHCNTLISTFGDLEITVEFLTEVDKLVQLIESPIFAYLRLELVPCEAGAGGAGGAALRRALYGLLMLLPQGEAFHALRRRLQCAPPLAAAPAIASTSTSPPPPPPPAAVDFADLLAEFHRVQASHRQYRLTEGARARAPPPAPLYT